MRDQLAPFLKIGRAAEILGMVLDRLPGDEQAIAFGLFDRAPQLHGAAALGALEDRRSLFHAGLEFRFHAGLDFDLGNFGDHDWLLTRFLWRDDEPSTPESF